MQKPNNRIDILSESAVFDYVAGNMSKDSQANFEQKLAHDKTLQSMVDAERELRAQLLATEQSNDAPSPIDDSSLQKLFVKLDELEGAPKPATNVVRHPRWAAKNWFGAAGIAASVALATVLFVGQQPTQPVNDFSLLSDQSQSKQIEFNELVAARKVAQVWLVSGLSSSELTALFEKNGLKPIGRAGQAWIVSSKQVLSEAELSSLKAIAEFEQISLISYNSSAGVSNR